MSTNLGLRVMVRLVSNQRPLAWEASGFMLVGSLLVRVFHTVVRKIAEADPAPLGSTWPRLTPGMTPRLVASGESSASSTVLRGASGNGSRRNPYSTPNGASTMKLISGKSSGSASVRP